jgi:hypothetical protein
MIVHRREVVPAGSYNPKASGMRIKAGGREEP